ncbi:MAG: site-2 protease family protein [Methanotrichaceae archaeon]|nr:site-2 protease family protein [Methanotrichaceae archaeon]
MSYFYRIGKHELIDLFVSVIVLIIAFSILGKKSLPSVEVVLISAVGVGTGFLLHELAHKFIAQRYGYWAEYKASWTGLFFMIIMSFMGFIFAAPGAVMIRKDINVSPQMANLDAAYANYFEKKEVREQLGIALAGPMTNILLLVIFLFMLYAGRMMMNPFLIDLAYFAFYINLILAAFNLIPIDPFDGGKIFRGSRLIWAIVALPTILLALIIILGISIL